VLALVGTDHHPFDRMVDWVDAATHKHRGVRFVVQHGATRAPLAAEGHDFLAHGLLVSLLQQASVVVCHGGPGTILDARDAGHVPLCVPRDPARGEHVDGHQQRFAAMMDRTGVVRTVSTVDLFERELSSALVRATLPGAAVSLDAEREASRARLASELDELIARRPHRFPRLHRLGQPA
jgi:UDP-N-acetylglucosamine transferase subunit ALG13